MNKPIMDKITSKGPIAWMAQNPVASNLLMLTFLAAGIVGMFKVNQEVFPQFELDTITVSVSYPGASPVETEQGIVLAVEEAVRGLDGVKRVTSTALEGSGRVTVELLLGANGDKVLQDVKNAVDRITSFPEESEKPKVSLTSTRSRVLSLIFYGDKPLKELHNIAEKARESLLLTDGITQVEIDGVPDLQISIEIPQDTLETYGLTLAEVASEIASSSVEVPGGSVKTKGGEVLVRVADRKKLGYEFEDIILRSTKDGSEIRLGDIATVTDGFEESDTASYFNGKRAVRVTAYRIGDETPRSVSDLVHAYKDEVEKELPSGVSTAVWRDASEILKSRIDLLTKNGVYGFAFVFLILAMFLNLRLAFWVSVGIPISFFGAFALMPAVDISINMISLFAFITTLGMVVDDAIVVGENIFEKMQGGKSKLRAAVEGTVEMAMPVTFSVLTTMAAFAPLFFVPGVMGKIFKVMPFIVIAVLGVSLVESFFILPAHLSHSKAVLSKKNLSYVEKFQAVIARGLDFFTMRLYRPFMEKAMSVRYITAAVAVAVLLFGVGLVLGGVVPFYFFPKVEGDFVRVSARLPYGSPLENTMKIQKALEASAYKAVEQNGGRGILRGFYTQLGQTAGSGPSASGEEGAHLVTITMNLVSSEERSVGAEKVSNDWSRLTPELSGVDSIVFSSSGGPGAGSVVDVQLSHSDISVLKQASEKLTEELRGFPDLMDIENGFVDGKTQLDFHLLPQARVLGLSALDIANQIRGAFYGAEAIREQRGRNEIRVMVRFPKSSRVSELDIDNMLIYTSDGGRVPLKYVASFERKKSPTSISREEGRRIIDVTAGLAPGVSSPTQVNTALRTEVLPKLKASFSGLRWEMVGQQREQQESFEALGSNFIIALFVIYALIAIPFKSYIQPFIIMSAIPFGFIGAVFGHWLTGYTLCLMSVLGMVALAGVVVNDSLVLIDTANKFRLQGKSPLESALTAGTRRMRPILLTSLTTFLGLAPMITETSMQAQFMIPMAVSLGFGVLFSTLVILVLVPAFYLIVEDVKALFLIKEAPAEQ